MKFKTSFVFNFQRYSITYTPYRKTQNIKKTYLLKEKKSLTIFYVYMIKFLTNKDNQFEFYANFKEFNSKFLLDLYVLKMNRLRVSSTNRFVLGMCLQQIIKVTPTHYS